MPDFEFVGQSAQDPDNRSAATSRLINVYREKVDGRTNYVLKGVLGTQAFATLGSVFVRAMKHVGDYIYVICGGSVFQVDQSGMVTNMGAVVDSDRTTISSNNGAVTIAAGGRYFVLSGGVITEPTPGAFSAFGSVGFAGQRTILTESGGRRVQWSGVTTPGTLGGLDFVTTESRDDDNLRVFTLGTQVWVLKEESVERWYLSNDTDFLAPIPGGTLDTGLKAFNLACEVPNGVFFVGSNNTVFLATEAGIKPISNVPVESAVVQGEPTACFYYEDEGHKFCVIRFDDRPAWAFDIASGEWHERAEGTSLGAWSAVAAVKAWGGFYVADFLGSVHRLARISEDATGPLVRRAVGRTIRANAPLRIRAVEFWANVGKSDLSYGPAKLMLRVSGDYANTWSQPIELSLGDLGEYWTRAKAFSLGQFTTITPEITFSDETDILVDAVANLDAA